MSNTAVASTPVHDSRAHLTVAQTQTLRTILAERIDAQLQRVDHAIEELDAFGPSDVPAEREMARESLASLREGARLLEDALTRLESGAYGICVACDRPIPFERLEAIPDVRHCVRCPNPG